MSIRTFFRKSTLLGITAVFFSAVLGVATKYAMEREGYWEVTFWGSVLSVVPLLATVPLFWTDLKRTKLRSYSGLLASVAVSFIGFLSVNKAFAVNVSITAAILSVPSSMIMAMLFSAFAPELLEKHTKRVYAVRLTAAAVMVIAALQLSG